MHFVAALDSVPEMRAVLALFEGVATGAADGYARMADQPGATLLHLGPGLGNGLANLHNARKGEGRRSSTSSATTRPTTRSTTPSCSRTSRPRRATSRPGCARRQSTEELARDAAEASPRRTGPPGQVATLILPGRRLVAEGAEPAPPPSPPAPPVARRATRSTASPRRCARAAEPRSCSAAARCASPALCRGRADRRGHRREAAHRGLPHPDASAAPGCRASSGSPISPSSRRCSSPGSST